LIGTCPKCNAANNEVATPSAKSASLILFEIGISDAGNAPRAHMLPDSRVRILNVILVIQINELI
jgi:hypothetical protein